MGKQTVKVKTTVITRTPITKSSNKSSTKSNSHKQQSKCPSCGRFL